MLEVNGGSGGERRNNAKNRKRKLENTRTPKIGIPYRYFEAVLTHTLTRKALETDKTQITVPSPLVYNKMKII